MPAGPVLSGKQTAQTLEDTYLYHIAHFGSQGGGGAAVDNGNLEEMITVDNSHQFTWFLLPKGVSQPLHRPAKDVKNSNSASADIHRRQIGVQVAKVVDPDNVGQPTFGGPFWLRHGQPERIVN